MNRLYMQFAGLIAAGCLPLPAGSEPTLQETAINGSISLDLRYRFEYVMDDFRPAGRPLDDANASTLRAALNYESGRYHGFSALIQTEHISRIFSRDYNNGYDSGSGHAVVADPDGTEINQGYLRYQGAMGLDVKAGRQTITYREAPFHRHVGTILWRQNWQSFDALAINSSPLADTDIAYAWAWNVNRIFGEDAPEPLSDFEGNIHLVNLQNRRFDFANIEVYAYLLDFDNAARFSSQTYGIRLSGHYPLGARLGAIYAVEYAHQSDHGNYPGRYSTGYQLYEAGFRLESGAWIDSFMLKAGCERLGGDGSTNSAFVTILGTNHAFQGTADRFLITPDDGVRDYYLTAVTSIHGFKLVASYHVLESDHLDYHYGRELDLELKRSFAKHYAAGIKFADYNADINGTNRLRNGPQAADARKFWFYVTAGF